MDRVTISEVAPRDGVQAIPGPMVPTETKIALIRALYDAGVRRMEAGSFVSPRAVPQMADAAEVLAFARSLPGLEPTMLVPNRKGFEAAMAAGSPAIGLFMSVTDSHNKANVNRSTAESFAELAAIVRDTPQHVAIRFNVSCAFHCPFEGVVPEAHTLDWIERVFSLDPRIEIGIADTTGNAAPDQVKRVFSHVIRAWTKRVAFHGHDTYGMGVANAAAAFEAGCRVFDGAAGGIGGCPFAPGASGNTATEDLVWMFRRMGVDTGLDWPKLLVAADLAAAIPGAVPGGRLRGVSAARRAA
jgi:hydroxymethylglutaryl-CoA lyase